MFTDTRALITVSTATIMNRILKASRRGSQRCSEKGPAASSQYRHLFKNGSHIEAISSASGNQP